MLENHYGFFVRCPTSLCNQPKRIVEAGGDLYHVSEQQMSLEEIYFSLIDREHAETERENT